MPVPGVTAFERFFRAAAGIDVDKNDLKRYQDFINQKVYDLLLRGEANASANGRDFIEPQDLPVTKGLQESIQHFKSLNQEIEIEPILEKIAALPQLHRDYTVETRERLPLVVGGLSSALARTFVILDPALKTPHSTQWERAFKIFDLLL